MGKVIVLGIPQRNGVIRAFPVRGRGRAKLERLIVANTLPGSLYYTDDWQAYASLAAVRGEHVIVRKDKGKARGREHINGIEVFGVMPNIGFILTGACRKSSSIFT